MEGDRAGRYDELADSEGGPVQPEAVGVLDRQHRRDSIVGVVAMQPGLAGQCLLGVGDRVDRPDRDHRGAAQGYDLERNPCHLDLMGLFAAIGQPCRLVVAALRLTGEEREVRRAVAEGDQLGERGIVAERVGHSGKRIADRTEPAAASILSIAGQRREATILIGLRHLGNFLSGVTAIPAARLPSGP